MDMARVEAYLEAHRGDFEEQLKALIRIPSVSAQPDHNADTRRAAVWVRDDLAAMGFESELIETKGHPIVYAEWLGAPGKPTLLVYGHYDVQPPEPLEPWLSPPFEPTVRNGNLYARGATDDKGQMFTHLKAAEAWLKTSGKLPINVKFVIEGEEEVGGANLEAYMADASRAACLRLRRHLRQQPVRPRQPGNHLRPERPGLLRDPGAGRQPRPALRDLRRGRRQPAERPGDDPRQPERRRTAGFRSPGSMIASDRWPTGSGSSSPQLAFSEEEFQADLAVTSLEGEAGYTTLERKWARPTCDVNGIYGGYAGPGPKTVLPCKAGAKLSFRLVPDQDPKTVETAVPRARRRGVPARA